MKFYRIHYPQINEGYIYVKAENPEKAVYRADNILRNECPSNDEEPIEITKEEYEE